MEQTVMKNIVITGFGPFGDHKVNASWEAVKQLSNISQDKLRKKYNVNLIIEEIPVVYNLVDKRIPELWKEFDPLFVIHVGVSHAAKCLTLENRAHGYGYFKKDVDECCPCEGDNCQVALATEIDAQKICKEINETGVCEATVSEDAGRYLCEYTYFQSLRVQCNKTLFVHVPDFHTYPTLVTAQGLDSIVCHLLDNLL